MSHVLDGISDVLFAALIDKCHMKLGKVRPWFLIAAPLLGISLYASFHVPDAFSTTAKVVYIYVTYTFVAAVAFTIYNLAYSAILPLMTLDSDNRNFVSTFGRFFTLGGITIMNYVTPLLLTLWGGTKNSQSWDRISLIYSILCAIFVFMMGLVIKEKHLPEEEVAVKQEEKNPHKESFFQNIKIVLNTKYTWLLILLFIVFYFLYSIYGIRSYYYRDVLGNLNFFSVGAMLASLPSLIVLPFLSLIFKKFEKRKVILFGMALYILATIVWTVFSRNLMVAYVCTFIMGASWTPVLGEMFVYIADVSDYILLKNKKHLEHVVGMSSSIGTKIGTGLGSALTGWGLTWIGYNSDSAAQSASTQSGLCILTTVIPLIGAVLIMLVIFFLDIDKEKKKLQDA